MKFKKASGTGLIMVLQFIQMDRRIYIRKIAEDSQATYCSHYITQFAAIGVWPMFVECRVMKEKWFVDKSDFPCVLKVMNSWFTKYWKLLWKLG